MVHELESQQNPDKKSVKKEKRSRKITLRDNSMKESPKRDLENELPQTNVIDDY